MNMELYQAKYQKRIEGDVAMFLVAITLLAFGLAFLVAGLLSKTELKAIFIGLSIIPTAAAFLFASSAFYDLGKIKREIREHQISAIIRLQEARHEQAQADAPEVH